MSSDARGVQSIGNYDLLAKIAEGGMGAVWRGRNRSTGEIVAIKIIPPETAKNPLLVKRFEQEYKAAALIDHPNVVKALDYAMSGATPFLVMEFVDGESLGGKVEREGAQPEGDAVRIIGQVCEGLHRAHKQGLIHRDVKPDNILVTKDGVAKLTDLGLVKDVDGEMNLTRTGRGLGTPHFMAPEQFRNAKNADVRCDVYSLGATLYTMLTGDVPFQKTSPLDCWLKKTKNDFPEPRKLNPRISERTNWAICRAMSADPQARPASCREFMEDLIGAGWKAGSGLIAAAEPLSTITPASTAEDYWYMVYRDETGQQRTVKGTTDSIRKNLTAGALGDTTSILMCRTKQGQFIPIKSIPEFRDLVVPASGVFAPAPSRDPENALQNPPSGGGSSTRLGARSGRMSPAPSGSSTRLPATNPSASGRMPRPDGGSSTRLPNVSGSPSGRLTPMAPPPTSRPVNTGTTEYYPVTGGARPSQPVPPGPTQPPAGPTGTGRPKFDPTPYLIAVVALAVGVVGTILFMK
ncbi:MAG: protein kinase domain-containing protein [Fimbriiglobus sp.]